MEKAPNANVSRRRSSPIRQYAHRVLAVISEGEDLTKDRKDRVEMSFVKEGVVRKSSNIPGGGIGAS